MLAPMQEQFKELSQFRGLWSGAKVATHQDLSALFVARVIQLYLRPEGRFGFLMPNTVVDLAQYEGFRKGDYPDQSEPVYVAFDRSWDLRKIRPHFFPRPCAAVFGRRVKRRPVKMTADAEGWFGKIPVGAVAWDEVKAHIERKKTLLRVAPDEPQSPYHERFRQGATIVPRVLFMVDMPARGPLGMSEGRVRVRSTRSANEKKPWKNLPRLEGAVETEHVRPVYVGSSILPYRTLPPEKAVLPLERKGLLPDERLARYEGLGQWWSKAEAAWLANRSSTRLSLREQLDYHGKLSNQFPLQPVRIVYGKSGMHLCCAVMRDRRAIIDHTLYWATPSTDEEAAYLCGILNAAITTKKVRPLMSHSKDERHIDKHLWRLPIPMFDAKLGLHARIARLATEVETQVAALELDSDTNSVLLRRQVRAHLAEDDTAQKLEKLVATLLSPPQSRPSKSRKSADR